MINLSEERILDFLDGRLATPDEEELLHTLAVSPERRQILRAHIRLREATNNLARQERFTVPENVTDQLFSRLEQAGFNPPPLPQSMIAPGTLTPESFAMPIAGAAGAAGAIATAVGSGWRFGMMGLLAASVMSFVLGAGAYYVFGSSLGLHTRSQELAMAVHRASPHGTASASIAASTPLDAFSNKNASSHTASNIAPSATHHRATVNNIADVSNTLNPSATITSSNAAIPQSVTPIVDPVANVTGDADQAPQIGLTAPKEVAYAPASDKMQFLNGPQAIWPNALAEPYAIDRGTMSVRYDLGPGPSSNNAPLSQMTELRFGWTMWNYVLWRATMGEMWSYQSTTKLSNTSGNYVVTASESNTPTTNTVVGLETGVTLDPIGVPIDALVGFLYAGAATNSSPFFGRASLMAHFEPWKLLEVSAGLEGILYSHSLTMSSPFRGEGASSVAIVQASPAKEMDGLVGPAIEIGWHF